MTSNKKWYEGYNFDLMDQQFKEEIERNPNFNTEEHIKDLRSLRKDLLRLFSSMFGHGYEPDEESWNKFVCYNRKIRYWKRYKIQKAIPDDRRFRFAGFRNSFN